MYEVTCVWDGLGGKGTRTSPGSAAHMGLPAAGPAAARPVSHRSQEGRLHAVFGGQSVPCPAPLGRIDQGYKAQMREFQNCFLAKAG